MMLFEFQAVNLYKVSWTKDVKTDLFSFKKLYFCCSDCVATLKVFRILPALYRSRFELTFYNWISKKFCDRVLLKEEGEGKKKKLSQFGLFKHGNTLFHYEMLKFFWLVFFLNFIIALAMVSVFLLCQLILGCCFINNRLTMYKTKKRSYLNLGLWLLVDTLSLASTSLPNKYHYRLLRQIRSAKLGY